NGLEGYTTQHGGSCGLAGPGNRYGTQRRIAEKREKNSFGTSPVATVRRALRESSTMWRR
ncbi:MAG: hypothetical protein ACQESR_27040, partial [Planctomycetota bacterium]